MRMAEINDRWEQGPLWTRLALIAALFGATQFLVFIPLNLFLGRPWSLWSLMQAGTIMVPMLAAEAWVGTDRSLWYGSIRYGAGVAALVAVAGVALLPFSLPTAIGTLIAACLVGLFSAVQFSIFGTGRRYSRERWVRDRGSTREAV